MKKILLTIAGAVFAVPFFVSAQSAPISDQFTVDTKSSCVDLKYNLSYGSKDVKTNGEVSDLQEFLSSKNYLRIDPTGYFGAATLAAVKSFQIDKNIGRYSTPGFGNVGPKSRAKIKEITCGTGTITGTDNTTTTTTTNVGSTKSSCTYSSSTGMERLANEYQTYTKDSCLATCVLIRDNVFGQTDSGTCTFKDARGNNFVAPISGGASANFVTTASSAPSTTPTATIDANSGSSTGGITIFGTATGVSFVGLAIGGTYGDKIYANPYIPVVNGQYRKVLSVTELLLTPGTLTIQIYNGNTLLTQKLINISTSATTTTVTPTATAYHSSYSSTEGLSILGTANNTTNFGVVVLGPSGNKIWGSGTIQVANGSWSILAPIVAVAGNNYTIIAYDNSTELARSYFSVPSVSLNPTTTVAPSLTVLSPNGGESYRLDQAMTVNWSATNVPAGGYFVVQFKRIDGDQREISLVATNNSLTNSVTYPLLSAVSPQLPIVPGTYKVTVWIAGVAENLSAVDSSNGNITITPAATIVVNPTTYRIYATANTGGTITPSGATSITSGNNQTYTITPNSGYAISSVVVDGVNQGVINSYTFTNVVANSHTITASFAPVVTVTPTTSTTVTGPSDAFAFGVYQGIKVTGSTEGTAYITIPMAATNKTLVLTAYESVNWVIKNPNNITVKNIIAIGYKKQRISGAVPNVPIEYDSHDTNGIYQFAYQSTDTYYTKLVTWLSGKNITLAKTNFYGTYDATTSTIFNVVAQSGQTSSSSQFASIIGAFTKADSSVTATTQLTSYDWTHNLEIGSPYKDDVSALQRALANQGIFTDEISGGFYAQTYLAVKAFQSKYGIEATGFVGPSTRAKLNELY